jgi:hypothetical protein
VYSLVYKVQEQAAGGLCWHSPCPACAVLRCPGAGATSVGGVGQRQASPPTDLHGVPHLLRCIDAPHPLSTLTMLKLQTSMHILLQSCPPSCPSSGACSPPLGPATPWALLWGLQPLGPSSRACNPLGPPLGPANPSNEAQLAACISSCGCALPRRARRFEPFKPNFKQADGLMPCPWWRARRCTPRSLTSGARRGSRRWRQGRGTGRAKSSSSW